MKKDPWKLTEREVEVIEAMCELGSRKLVAEELYIAKVTVDDHMRHLMAKMREQTALRACVEWMKWKLGEEHAEAQKASALRLSAVSHLGYQRKSATGHNESASASSSGLARVCATARNCHSRLHSCAESSDCISYQIQQITLSFARHTTSSSSLLPLQEPRRSRLPNPPGNYP
jgi:DNA-binding CsgD family transcriptional regulator